jgi:Inner membrane component of T3SS, cytoplasmic domain
VSDDRRIVLTEDDFGEQAETPAVTASPASARPSPAASVALPRVARGGAMNVAAGPAAPPLAWPRSLGLNRPTTTALGAALVGMLAAWAFTEVTRVSHLPFHAHSRSGLHAYTGIWTGVVAVVFAAVLIGYDRAVGGAFGAAGRRALRAALPAFVIGFGAGFVASVVYVDMVERVFRAAAAHGTFPSADDARLYLARALGWAIFGCGVGVTIGVIDRSRTKSVNGAVGGALGGALGGAVFNYSAVHLHNSDRTARLLGLVAVGVLVAVATRAVEAVRRDAWVSVVAGGMAGKEFILYHPVTRIGSAPDCELFLLKDPAVEPLHAQVTEQGMQRVLTASPAAPVYVNQRPTTNHVLRSGDTLQIGNTVLAYSERASAPAAAPRAQQYR